MNLVYENGAAAGLYATMLSNTDKQGKIYGTEGYIVVENINNYAGYQIYDRQGDRIDSIERPEQISGLEYEVQACIHAIQKGALECPLMTHADTLFLMRILDTVRKAWNLRYPQEEPV